MLLQLDNYNFVTVLGIKSSQKYLQLKLILNIAIKRAWSIIYIGKWVI